MLDETPPLWQVLAARIGSFVNDIKSLLLTLGPNENNVGFSIALIALSAKLAKADGKVTVDEVRVFRSILDIPPHEEANAALVFNLCRQDMTGYATYARQMVRILGDSEASHQRRLDVLDALFYIAMADGEYHPEEANFLKNVATIFDCSPEDFLALQSRHVPEIWNPWTVLGLPSNAGFEEMRAAWKRLVRESHPDLMIARGAPTETITLANRRIADLTRAQGEIIRLFAIRDSKTETITQASGASESWPYP